MRRIQELLIMVRVLADMAMHMHVKVLIVGQGHPWMPSCVLLVCSARAFDRTTT